MNTGATLYLVTVCPVLIQGVRLPKTAEGLWHIKVLALANLRGTPFVMYNSLHDFAGCDLTPMISSHSMNATSPRRPGNAILETVSAYSGSSKPVKLIPR